MNDSTSTEGQVLSSSNPASAPVTAAVPAFEPVALFTVLASPLRWQILQMMKSGEALTASQVASVVQRDFDGVSKHLRLMREACVLASQPGEDRRNTHYFLPAEFRREPGVLDFGVCRVRLG